MICIANKNVLKYGIPRGVCGVYMIKNKITNDFYIGSSVEIEGRLSTHFGRDAKRYINHPLYQAINNYDFDDLYKIINTDDNFLDKMRSLYASDIKSVENLVGTELDDSS